MKISDRIKNKRKELGLSVEEVAKQLDKNRATVYRYENEDIENLPVNILEPLARILQTTPAYLMGWEESPYILRNEVPLPADWQGRGVRIPILGKVIAGVPCEAIEDILGHIEISPEQAMNGEHFSLIIKGNSMFPQINEGDIVVVQKNFELEDGDTVILSINGDEATCKKVFKQGNGIMVQANNPEAFKTCVFTDEQINDLPVVIIGKVVELRRNF